MTSSFHQKSVLNPQRKENKTKNNQQAVSPISSTTVTSRSNYTPIMHCNPGYPPALTRQPCVFACVFVCVCVHAHTCMCFCFKMSKLHSGIREQIRENCT